MSRRVIADPVSRGRAGVGRPPLWECLSAAAGFAVLFSGALALRLHPNLLDRSAARILNRFAVEDGDGAINHLANAMTYPAVQGVAVVSLACGCWFMHSGSEVRRRLLRGSVAAVAAALAALVVQELIPVVLKPIFDPAAQVHPASVLGGIDSLRAAANPNSQSFPSERATLYAGVAIAVFASSRPIGTLALLASIVPELCRIYLGLHYPSDILGSFLLAAAIFWLMELEAPLGLDGPALRWERISPASFYTAAFAACYGLATAFEDLRTFLSMLRS